jgi:hypothetical protein
MKESKPLAILSYSSLIFSENLSVDRMPSSENPGGSDELVSRPGVSQSGLLKATMTGLALRISFLIESRLQ